MTPTILYARFNQSHIGLSERDKRKKCKMLFKSFIHTQKQTIMKDPGTPGTSEEVVNPPAETTATEETAEVNEGNGEALAD